MAMSYSIMYKLWGLQHIIPSIDLLGQYYK